jgi:hypothetical protein
MFYSSDQAVGWTTNEELLQSGRGKKCSPTRTCPDGSAFHQTYHLMCNGGGGAFCVE